MKVIEPVVIASALFGMCSFARADVPVPPWTCKDLQMAIREDNQHRGSGNLHRISMEESAYMLSTWSDLTQIEQAAISEMVVFTCDELPPAIVAKVPLWVLFSNAAHMLIAIDTGDIQKQLRQQQ